MAVTHAGKHVGHAGLLAARLELAFNGLSALGDAPLAALNILPEGERRTVLTGWNTTAREYHSGLTIHAAFEAQAARTPDAPALVFEDETLSYAQLNARANAVAAKLQAMGVKPGSHVGLYVKRGPALVTGALAVLKADGAYVPLDPAYPAERIAHYVTDSQAQVILSETALMASFPASDAKVLDISEIPAPAGNLPNVQGGATGGDLAYLIYTSGSTGKPKAVIVPERGILRLAVPGYLPLQSPMRFGHASNPSFDALSFDLWAPLLSGGTCVVIPEEVSEDFAGFERHLQEAGVETMFLTVALFNAIAEDRPNCFSALSHLLIGGEQINLPRVQAWYQANPKSHCKIYNVYGPISSRGRSKWLHGYGHRHFRGF